jgi:hypothetical protein
MAALALVVAMTLPLQSGAHGPATGPIGHHAVWRIAVPTLNASNHLRTFLASSNELDVWRELRSAEGTTDVSIPQHAQPTFAKYLDTIGASSEIFIDDGKSTHPCTSVSFSHMYSPLLSPSPRLFTTIVDTLIADQFKSMDKSKWDDSTDAGYINVSRYHRNEVSGSCNTDVTHSSLLDPCVNVN